MILFLIKVYIQNYHSMKKMIWLFFAFLGISCQQPSELAGLSIEVKNKIDALFKEYNTVTPGYAIGISKGNSTLYQNGYGAANLDYNLPITPQSTFSIASVSKQFTAACIALLILENKITLETPAQKHIPTLKKYQDTIRIKHLIYNTSGIVDYHQLPRKNGQSWITFNYFDVEECIATSLAQDTLKFKPGERWDYCNVNFMLLAKIVENISGQSFAKFAQNRLFQPLGMTNTLINDDITNTIKNRVMPYNLRNEETIKYYNEVGIPINKNGKYIQHHRNSPHYGGSGVMTTIEDILKWSKNMIIKDFGGEKFYTLIHKKGKFNHDRDNQAFGLYFGDFNGKTIIAWDGGDWGISSQLIRFPDSEVAIAVFANFGDGRSFEKANQIADILTEEGFIE
jgi:CubicO group peptidase (beta-lactamase class C family)